MGGGEQGGEDAKESEGDSLYKHRKAVIITQAIEYIRPSWGKQLARLGAIIVGKAASSRTLIVETLGTIQDGDSKYLYSMMKEY